MALMTLILKIAVHLAETAHPSRRCVAPSSIFQVSDWEAPHSDSIAAAPCSALDGVFRRLAQGVGFVEASLADQPRRMMLPDIVGCSRMLECHG